MDRFDETGLETAPADDLRATLTAAFEGKTTTEPEAPSVEPPEADEDPIAKEAAEDRARDGKGRFAKQEQERQAAEAEAKAPEQQEATQEVQAVKAPPGWSIAAKAAFDKADPAIREAVARREQEINAGFAKLAEYKPLERFAEMARAGGTTLANALENYTGIERELASNPVTGFARIAQNMGLNPVEVAQNILRAYGQPGNQTPEAETMGQQPDISALLHRELMPLRKTVEQLQAERQQLRQSEVTSAIERFMADPANKYAENVMDDMLPFINQRRATNPSEPYEATLKAAYDKAIRANDETFNLLIKERLEAHATSAAETARAARNASKSVTGSPTAGASSVSEPASSLREELERQFGASGSRA